MASGATTLRGLTLAFAFPVAGDPPLSPDRHHYFVRHGDTWSLIDIRKICRAAGVPLPAELTHPYWEFAVVSWLEAVARVLSRLPTAAPQPTPPDAPARFWWLDL